MIKLSIHVDSSLACITMLFEDIQKRSSISFDGGHYPFNLSTVVAVVTLIYDLP